MRDRLTRPAGDSSSGRQRTDTDDTSPTRHEMASILHTLGPFALEISPGMGVRWYGLAYLAGFVVAWMALRWMAKTGRSMMTVRNTGDFVTAMVLSVLVGGRVGHVLLYEPSLLWTFGSGFPFWGLLEIHKGGMSSHGGMVGVAIAVIWFARTRGLAVLHVMDCAAFICCPGLMFGRLANWVNGELWGRALPESMQSSAPWWSVKYPVQIYEGNFDLSLAEPARAALAASGVAGAEASSAQWPQYVVQACYSGNRAVIDALEPVLTAYYPSNFFQAITDGPILMGVLALVWWRPRKPGVIAGWFLITYGVLREVTEQFREPDQGVLMVGPLTLPMLISVVMVVVGAGMVLACSRRRGVEPVGGLRRLG